MSDANKFALWLSNSIATGGLQPLQPAAQADITLCWHCCSSMVCLLWGQVCFVCLVPIQWNLLLRPGVCGILLWEVSLWCYYRALVFMKWSIWLEQSRSNLSNFIEKYDGGCIKQSPWSSHGLYDLKSLQDSPFLIYGLVVRTLEDNASFLDFVYF